MNETPKPFEPSGTGAWVEKIFLEQQAKLKEQQELATKDSKTGLYNERGFKEALSKIAPHEHERRAGHGPVTLMLLDLVRFKKINDERGQDFGDEVIKAAAQAVRDLARAEDLVGRQGGDEFVIAYHGASEEDIRRKFSDDTSNGLRQTLKISIENEPLDLEIRAMLHPFAIEEGEDFQKAWKRVFGELSRHQAQQKQKEKQQ